MSSQIRTDLIKDKSNTKTLATLSSSAVTLDSTVVFPAGGTGNAISVAVICDEKAHNADAGDSVVGWQDRELNTEISDPDGIVSISSDQFTLDAGTYLINWRVPAWKSDRHFSKLYNVTGTADLRVSQAGYNLHSTGNVTFSVGSYIHTIGSSNTYEIKQYIQDAQTTDGLGIAHDLSGYNSIYTIVYIYKLK